MGSREKVLVTPSRMVAVEFAVAILVAAAFALLAWVGSGYRWAAALMPVTVSGLGAIAALTWAGSLLTRSPRAEGRSERSNGSFRRLGTLAMLMVGFVVIIPYVGFFTATLVFMFVGPVLMGLRPVWHVALAAAGLSLLLWLIFVVLLKSPMPADLNFGG